jgi:hypothetical protein
MGFGRNARGTVLKGIEFFARGIAFYLNMSDTCIGLYGSWPWRLGTNISGLKIQ